MERCPICRAALAGAEVCRRCQAELGAALRVGRDARRLAGEAMLRLMSGDAAGARLLLGRARVLHDAADLKALDLLLQGASDQDASEGIGDAPDDAEPRECRQEPELEGEGEPEQARAF
jgi:hypothetical protein